MTLALNELDLGIDISHHNVVDWEKFNRKNSERKNPIKFAIIRAGFGINGTDVLFEEHIKSAAECGLHVGVYWFMYAESLNGAKNNAKRFLEKVEKYKEFIDMGYWADWEYDSDKLCKPRLTKAQRTQFVNAFCEKVEKETGFCGNYMNEDYRKNMFENTVRGHGNFNNELWYAKLNCCNVPCAIQQYSHTGRLVGFNGNVDLDVMWHPILRKNWKIGDNCPEVGLIQEWLNDHGYKCEIDCIFGRETQKAVQQAQYENLLNNDGIVGFRTLTMMFLS